MTNHWIRYLPEAGTITLLAKDIEDLESDIQITTDKLARFKKQRVQMEKEAVRCAYKGGWTGVDIAEAKTASREPGRHAA